MKVTEPLSAFAIYKNTYKKNKVLPAKKLKLKKKLKFKDKKIRSPSAKGVNSKEICLAVYEDNAELITKKNSIHSKKLKNKIPTKLKSPDSKKDKRCAKICKKQKHKKSEEGVSKVTMKSTLHNSPVLNSSSTSLSLQDPILKGYQLFEWMIAPITPNIFFERYWETAPLYLTRTNKKYYTHLLTSKCLDQIFRDNSLYYTRNVDVVIFEKEEKQVLNPEGKANPSALWDFYSNGCSIRILNPQTYNKKVHLLVSSLQEYFGSMVGVNAYLTPPNSQGFAPHFDDIEAFVIQLEGRKQWKFYHPKEEDFLARHSSKNFTHEEIGDPFLEVILEEGSLLYFPRGIIHEGKTDKDSHSLHLTVSLYQNNAYVDLLENALPNALMHAAKSHIEFRKGLPLHFLRNEDSKQLIVSKMASLIDKLKDYLDIDKGISALGRKLVYNSMPPVLSKEEIACSSKQDGDLLDNGIVYNKVEFDLSTKIRLTRYHCIQLIYDDQTKSKLYYSTENANVYHGEEEQFLDLDTSMVPAIKVLKKAYPSFIEIDLLPLESIEMKIQFVYDLWEKGIVITDKPQSSSATTDESFNSNGHNLSE